MCLVGVASWVWGCLPDGGIGGMAPHIPAADQVVCKRDDGVCLEGTLGGVGSHLPASGEVMGNRDDDEAPG